MSNIALPYTQIIDPAAFKSVLNAKIYIGEYGTLPNPANSATWKQAYFVQDDGSRVAASQPIRTNAAGFAVDGSGNIRTVQVDGQYSLLVQDSLSVQKYSNTRVNEFSTSEALTVDTITAVNATGLPDGIVIIAKGRSTVGDGGGGIFRYSASSTQTADGGLVFAPASGSGRLFRDGWTVFGFNGRLNVKWFGAKGDGTADDLAALNNTSTAAAIGSQGIDLPDGTYVTTGTWSITRAVDLFADGAIIKPTVAVTGPCIRFGVNGSTPRPSGTKTCIVQGLELDGSNTTNAGSHGIDMWCSHVEVRNNAIHNFAGHGIYGTSAWSNLVHHNRIYSNALDGIHLDAACNSFGVISNYIIGNSQNGVYVSGCNKSVVMFNDIEGNARNAVRIIGTGAHATRSVTVANNYFEVNGTEIGFTDDIYVDRSGNEIAGLLIEDNYHETVKNINIASVGSATVRRNTGSTLILGDDGYNVFAENQAMGNYDSTVSNAFKGTYMSQNSTDGLLIEGRLVGLALRRKSVGNAVDAFYVRNPGNTDRAEMYVNGSIQLSAQAAVDIPNNSIYRSSADNKLYFKDNAGTSNALY